MTIFSVIKVATAVGLLAMRGASALSEMKDSKKKNAPSLINSAVLRAKNLTDRILPVLNGLTASLNQIPIGGYNNMYANNYNYGMAQAMPYPNLTAAWTGQQPQPHHDYNYDVLMGRVDPNWGHEEIMRMYANSGYIPPNYPYGYEWRCMFTGQPSVMDSGSRRDCDVLGLSRYANQVPPGYEQYGQQYQQYLNQQQQQRSYWNHVPGTPMNTGYDYSNTSSCWFNNHPQACWSADDAWGDNTNLSSYGQQQQYPQNMMNNGMNDSRRNQQQQNPYVQNQQIPQQQSMNNWNQNPYQQQNVQSSGLSKAREEEIRRQIWGDQYNWRMEQLRQQQAQIRQVSQQMMPQQQSPYPYPYGYDSQTSNWYPQQNQPAYDRSINDWNRNPYQQPQNMQNPMMNNDPNEAIRQMQEKQHWEQIQRLLEEEDRPKYYQRPANMQMNNYGQQFQQPINDWNQSPYAQQQYQQQNMGYNGYNNYQQPGQPYDPYEYQRQALADPNRDPYHTNETVKFVNPYYESRKPYEPLPGTVTPENPRGIPDLRNHLYMTGFEDNPSGIDPWADFIKNSRLINDPKYANDFKHCKDMYQFKSSSPQSSLYNGGVDMSQAMPAINSVNTDFFDKKEDGSANLIRPITGFADPGDPRNLLIGRGGSSSSKNNKKKEYTEEEEKAIQDMITNRIIEDSVKDLPPMHLTEEDLARFRWHGEGPDPFDKYRREIMMEKAMKHAENYYAHREMGVPEATAHILGKMNSKQQQQNVAPTTTSERTPEPGYEEPDPSMVVPCMYADDGTPIV